MIQHGSLTLCAFVWSTTADEPPLMLADVCELLHMVAVDPGPQPDAMSLYLFRRGWAEPQLARPYLDADALSTLTFNRILGVVASQSWALAFFDMERCGCRVFWKLQDLFRKTTPRCVCQCLGQVSEVLAVVYGQGSAYSAFCVQHFLLFRLGIPIIAGQRGLLP
jgi:hypothetical protein